MNENAFEELYHGLEAPPHIKKEVMQSIRMAKLMMDVGELFAVQPSKIAAELMRGSDGEDDNNETT
jgi:hypothetical protein